MLGLKQSFETVASFDKVRLIYFWCEVHISRLLCLEAIKRFISTVTDSILLKFKKSTKPKLIKQKEEY